MRILFVCDKLITFILNDISELSTSGHKISILSIHRDRSIYEKIVYPYLIDHGLEKRFFINWNITRSRKDKLLNLLNFIKFTCIDIVKNPIFTLKSIYYLFSVYDNLWTAFEEYNYSRILFSEKFDVIHAPFSTPIILKKIFLLSKIINVPYTLSFRAHDLYNENDFATSLRKRHILEQASAIITISNYNKQVIQDQFGDDTTIKVIHGGVKTDYFSPLPIDKVKRRIISIGRFHEQKGLIYLLQACEILQNRNFSFECIIIGEGPEKDSFVDFIKRNRLTQVKLFDYMDRDGIKKELAKSELFVLPCIVASDGLRDMLANALKEAMAMELPVITSDISGVEELVVDGHCGILMTPKDPLAIADAIETILMNDELRVQMGQAGRKQILEYFNVSVEAKKLETIFQEVIYPEFSVFL